MFRCFLGNTTKISLSKGEELAQRVNSIMGQGHIESRDQISNSNRDKGKNECDQHPVEEEIITQIDEQMEENAIVGGNELPVEDEVEGKVFPAVENEEGSILNRSVKEDAPSKKKATIYCTETSTTHHYAVNVK